MISKKSNLFSPSSIVKSISLSLFWVVFASLSWNMGSECLNVLQWNCRSLNTNLEQLTQHLVDSEICYDVLALQSIGGISFELPQIPGFHHPPYFTIFDNKVRTATYVKKDTQSSYSFVKDLKNGHALTVELENEDPITIINVYYPEGIREEKNLEWILNTDKRRLMILGDFNSHSPLWNPDRSHAENGGEHIENLMDKVDLCILNDGTITRIPDVNHHRPSAIDLSFCSSNLFLDCEWEVLDDPLGSDHLPISIRYSKSPEIIVNVNRKKYIYDKANWTLFRSILESAEYHENFTNVDTWYGKFQEIVISAANRSIPVSRHHNSKPLKKVNLWWNEECAEQRSVYRKLVKKYKRYKTTENLENMKKQKIQYNRILAQAKLRYWSTYVEENVQTYRDSHVLYKKLREVKGRYDPPAQPLELNGVKTSDPKEKAEILVKTFSFVSQNKSLNDENLNYRLSQESKMIPPQFNNSAGDSPFSDIELNKALFGIRKIKKATGSDPISYSMIKKFPGKTKAVLLNFFNHLWNTGTLPSAWKEAQVSAIPKQGKPKKDPKSYRPISLTPHISKVYERLVKNRFEYFLEKNRLLPTCQSGFRRGRSCIENLVKLSSHVKRAMMRRRPVLATFYDIKRAYDTVWHQKLLLKLSKLGISRNMYRFFEVFLKNRVIRVAVGSELSGAQNLDMGIPQGSIIAPLAFSVMLGDIHKLKLKNASLSMYADDLAMWATSRYRRTNTNSFLRNELINFQNNVNVIVEYMEQNGFALAPDKTVFMVFTTGRIDKDISISIYNSKILPSNEVKYLGVVLDKTFSFQSHINHLIKKTRKNLYLIKVMKREIGSNNIKMVRTLLNSLVRSRLTYGQEIFYSAPTSYLEKLQSTETAIIKTLLNIPKTANPILVYREVGMKPLSFIRKLQTTKATFRLGGTENDIEEELSLDFNDKHSAIAQSNYTKRPRIYRKSISISGYVQDLVHEAGVGDCSLNVIPQCRFHCPPWDETEYDITPTLGDLNKTDHLNLLTITAREHLDKLKDYVLIFTDGSILKEGNTGCAFVVPEFGVCKKFKMIPGISIFSAEMFAVEKAIEFAKKRVRHDKVCIVSDSKSVLQALQNQSYNRFDSVSTILTYIQSMQNRGKTVKLQWVPSHVGLRGNDLADRAAKEAACDPNLQINDIGFSLSEITAKLTKASDDRWQKEFSKIANALAWCNPEITKVPPFIAPAKYSEVFMRLRCNSTRYDIYQALCSCSNAYLTVNHIFNCCFISAQLILTKTFCSREEVSFSYRGIMSYHDRLGWEPAKIFVWEIVNSDIGHLL